MLTTKEKLTLLRTEMKKVKLDAYYVPSTDPHQSEYVPECWQRRKWLSGFTGSAGDLVITQNEAGLWTDGRYFLQAENELKGSSIQLLKMGMPNVPSLNEWISTNLKKGQVLGVDPKLLSQSTYDQLNMATQKGGAKLKFVEHNLVDAIWENRPSSPKDPMEILSTRFAGETFESKLERLRQEMKKNGAAAHVLSALDTIAWLFNIRGNDVDHNPVVISYALITQKKSVLFVDKEKTTSKVRKKLAPFITIYPYEDLPKHLTFLTKGKGHVWVDVQSTNMWVIEKLKKCKLIKKPSPIWLMKAKKNSTEIAGIKRSHVRDGQAMVNFLCWLEKKVPTGKVTELSAAKKLVSFRAQEDLFRAESFDPIMGYGPHGAIIHYSATKKTNSTLRSKGILLIDSGGQYQDGTTDITRTVFLGKKATPEQKKHFTLVLKGHIAISCCRFPAGTAGRQIDVLARLALWEQGLQYNHGTGHGVGFFLNVHEGPQAISPTRCTGVALEEGNLLSNEPGYYKEGQYGIRIENLILVVTDKNLSTNDLTFFKFEEITLCPIDTRLIDKELLTTKEIKWINDYHETVKQKLTPGLPSNVVKWLNKVTQPI